MQGPGVIILAAGSSSRMGRPKQLLPWKGRTLLRHACETALATSCAPVIVVLGCEAEACARDVNDLSVITVVNAKWELGMGTSVASGISALETIDPGARGAILMLVDQPAVTPSFLERLLSEWTPPDPSIVATRYGDDGGVPALFASSYFSELRALDSARGARAILAREKSHVRLIDPECELIDLDTPSVYAAQSSGAR
jgi:molybdenum cofactor cytidylyltransferase